MRDKNMSKKGKKLDLFCWKCHKSETNIGCSGCERSFHNKCISITKNIRNYDTNWVCGECVDIQNNHFDQLDSIQLQQLLLLSLKMISKSSDYYFSEDNCFADKRIKTNSHLIVNRINLKIIEEQINAFQYKSFRHMVSDFKWILHNCIVGGVESGLLQNAKFLLSKAKSELKDFEECIHCFINYYRTSKTQYYSWFSKPCPRLHTLVWAKVKGHPFWPSKVIKPNQQNYSVLVRFFGTHQKSWVKEKDCYLISEQSPKELVGKAVQMRDLLNSAMEEMGYHIQYLRKEYPNWFEFAPKQTKFSIDKMMDSINNSITSQSKPVLQTNSESVVPKTLNTKPMVYPNRPIGWRPKARKTFPTPPISKPSEMKAKTESSNLSNPFEISFVKPNAMKKSIKTKPKIEIIEFESQSVLKKQRKESLETEKSCAKNEIKFNSIQNEVENEIVFKTVQNPICIQKSNNLKVEDMSEKKSIFISNLESNDKETKNCEMKAKPKKGIETKVNNKCLKAKELLAQNRKSKQMNEMKKTLKSLRERIKFLENKMKSDESSHRRQMKEVQQNADQVVHQMRCSSEADKQMAVIEERNLKTLIQNNDLTELEKSFDLKVKQMNERHELEIKGLKEKFNQELTECKTKIWCFSCLKEAELYCCSHTYYCTIECQRKHWEYHKSVCTQK